MNGIKRWASRRKEKLKTIFISEFVNNLKLFSAVATGFLFFLLSLYLVKVVIELESANSIFVFAAIYALACIGREIDLKIRKMFNVS